MKIDIIKICEIAIKASKIIMKFYATEHLTTSVKSDNSPVTNADHASSEFIINSLMALYPNILTVSEEGHSHYNLKTIRENEYFWLIDPIDGTWGFLNQRGDFVINIALIKNGIPIIGVINAPLHNTTYYNDGDKVYKFKNNKSVRIFPNTNYDEGLDFLVSDSNINQGTQDFIKNYHVKTVTPVASAYKYALMVNGNGDIHPRFKPTYIWDTAAGHALLIAVGGEIYDLNFKPLRYNKELLNPNFIAVVDKQILNNKIHI